MFTPIVVTLLGKLGHGKTYLLNKLTGTSFPSDARGKSCTRHLQYGYSKKEGFVIVDTPGFYASDDVTSHIAAQKLALEGTSLSGVYIVARCGRADEIAESVDKIMTVVGGKQFRLIVTHEDVVSQEDGYNKQDLIKQLALLLDLSTSHILIIGKSTASDCIEDFIKGTLHEPMDFTLSEEQLALAVALGVGTRRLNKPIQETEAKIAAANKDCVTLTARRKSYESDIAVLVLQKATHDAVVEAKDKIFYDATMDDTLSDEQKNLVYGKAGLALSLKLKEFMKSTNSLLSWDMTDILDVRNQYKKCNYCGAAYVKIEGCDGGTTCGLIPSNSRRVRPSLDAEFRQLQSKWVIQFFWGNKEIDLGTVLSILEGFFCQNLTGTIEVSQEKKAKPMGATLESGCGARISWSSMIPVRKEEIQVLGEVELCQIGGWEDEFKQDFQKKIKKHEATNKLVLDLYSNSS
jgi:50S ribosome-binding GTPase